jgi:RNA polymerase sigma-70 factor (ECF subfamily)
LAALAPSERIELNCRPGWAIFILPSLSIRTVAVNRDETHRGLVSSGGVRSTRELPAGAESRAERILAAYRTWLRRTLARLHPRGLPIDVDDVEQEVLVKLWKVLQSEREIEDLPSYIYRIASTTTIDAMRKARSRRESVSTEELGELTHQGAGVGRSPEELAASALLLRRIQGVLGELPENRRRAVALHLQGFTTKEVADLLGWREPKARNLVYRGMKSLRAALKERGIETASG